MAAVLHILSAGPGATLQDGGRDGYLRFGVTPAGPMDRLAFDTANRALGNLPGRTGVEISLGGLECTAEGGALAVALAGGDFRVTLDDRLLPTPVLLRLEPGARLRIAAGAAGAWCYLAVGGRIDVPPMLGSTATHVRSGFGGVAGRPLAAGDRLAVTDLHEPAAYGRLDAPWLLRPADVIRVVLGPQDDYFTPEAVAAFLAGPWRVSTRGDRMAYFLEGPRLTHGAEGFNIVSDGVAMGAIQVPGEGQPIVLMADRQPTGGYPKIATVIGADLGRLAQARPGQNLRFSAVTVEEAVAARRAAWDILEAGIAVSPLKRTEFSPAFLRGQDLTDVPCPAAGRLTEEARLAVLFDEAPAAPDGRGRVEGRAIQAASLTDPDLAGRLRAAAAAGLPFVLMLDGARTGEADDMAMITAAFAGLAVPRLALVLGPCTGEAALLAQLADVTILSEDRGFIAAGGPVLVERLTGERLDGAEIGDPAAGVERVPHEVAALLRARRVIDLLPDSRADAPALPPLSALVPHDPAAVYDMHDLLTAAADGGEVLELGADCAGNVITALARCDGQATGILASQPRVLGGVLDAAALAKAAGFVELCGRLGLPLVMLVDCPGLLPGPAEERAGLLTAAARLTRALAALPTPRTNRIIRPAPPMVAALLLLRAPEAEV